MTRVEHLPWEPGDRLDRVRAADPDGAGAEPAGIGRVRVGANNQFPRKGVLLEHNLMDDARTRSPEAGAVFGCSRTQEIVDLLVLGERLAEILPALVARLDQVVAMHRRRHGDLVAPRLHELQQTGLPQYILEHDAVGPGLQIALARLELLVLRVVEMPEQYLVG